MAKKSKNNIPDPSDLPALNQAELEEMIEKHAMYLRGQIGGARMRLQYHDLSNLYFDDCNLTGADFAGSSFVGANLSGANLSSSNFFACDLRNADLKNSNMSRTDLRGAYLAGANLTGADLSDADMREGKVMKKGKYGILEDRKRAGGTGAQTVLSGAKLGGTNMSGVQASNADFSDADLSAVSLENADLAGVNFEGANLTDSNMSGSNLSNVNMNSTIIAGTVMERTERNGTSLTSAITERDMGTKLENLGKTLQELLEEHMLWVDTTGKKGQQLDLSGYDLRDVIDLRLFPLTAIKAIGANFLGQNLREAELQSANFDRCDFRDCTMDAADLRGSSFKYAEMARVSLIGAMLCPLEFENKDGSKRFQHVNLSGANLRYAEISYTDLRECILMGVDLSYSILMDCDLRRADLTGALLTGCTLDNCNLEGAIIDLSAL